MYILKDGNGIITFISDCCEEHMCRFKKETKIYKL